MAAAVTAATEPTAPLHLWRRGAEIPQAQPANEVIMCGLRVHASSSSVHGDSAFTVVLHNSLQISSSREAAATEQQQNSSSSRAATEQQQQSSSCLLLLTVSKWSSAAGNEEPLGVFPGR